ncbi:hypothetical protein I5535_09880 [Rhodobacteraceae bacterium F11138]|nr:hypothetical protein [Rhodobacteraceae bacterium F11138]
MSRLLSTVLILLLAAAPVLAQGYGGYGGASSKLSDHTTNKVVRLLERGLRQCQSLDSVYRYDCYRQNYGDAARRLDENPAYLPAQQALQHIEATLQNVLSANSDSAADTLRRRDKTFTAINSSAVPQSKAAFTAALETARTQLLRTPDTGGDHFSRIAKVLDSNKVFLRS